MNIDFLDRRRAERFAQLLDETDGGPRHHSHGRGDDDLAGLAAVGSTMTAMRTAVRTDVDPEFRADLRAMLIATAEREGIGITAGPDALEQEPRSRWLTPGAGSGRRLRARGAIVAGVAVGAVAVSGMSFASESAVPGDALYGVKRSTEKAQLALAGSDVSRGQLFLGFARNRLAEASAVQSGRSGLAGVLSDMDNDTREGVRLLHGAAIQRKDPAPLNAVNAFVAGQRRQIQPLLSRVGAGDEGPVVASLKLLDAVEHRAAGLRDALQCGTVGADGLGPLPKNCSAVRQDGGTNSEGTGERGSTGKESVNQRGTGNDQKDQQDQQHQQVTGPAAGAGDPTGGGKPTPQPSGTAPAEPSPGTTEQPPADQSGNQDQGGVLDRIFGGILG